MWFIWRHMISLHIKWYKTYYAPHPSWCRDRESCRQSQSRDIRQKQVLERDVGAGLPLFRQGEGESHHFETVDWSRVCHAMFKGHLDQTSTLSSSGSLYLCPWVSSLSISPRQPFWHTVTEHNMEPDDPTATTDWLVDYNVHMNDWVEVWKSCVCLFTSVSVCFVFV